MQDLPGFALVALDTLRKLAQRARDIHLSSHREAAQLEALRIRAVKDGNLVEAQLLAAEIKATKESGVRLRKEAEAADWRHMMASRFLDDLPEDAFVARAPEGPRPTSDDPATALGVKVVALA